jgi:hypothetical protein
VLMEKQEQETLRRFLHRRQRTRAHYCACSRLEQFLSRLGSGGDPPTHKSETWATEILDYMGDGLTILPHYGCGRSRVGNRYTRVCGPGGALRGPGRQDEHSEDQAVCGHARRKQVLRQTDMTWWMAEFLSRYTPSTVRLAPACASGDR